MSDIIASKYFAYIATAYGVTFAVLMIAAVAIILTYRSRRQQLLVLEQAGLKRRQGQTATGDGQTGVEASR